MKSRYWIILGLAVALITLFAVPLYLYNRPLGPPLQLEQPAAAAARDPSQLDQGQPLQLEKPAAQGQSTDSYCDGSGLVNMLYLGQNLPETPNRGADAIRLMFVNYDTPAVGVIALPPDLLVDVKDIPAIDPNTLTYAFWYQIQPPPAGPPAAVRKATEVVAQSLLDTFAYTTEKYMTMNQPVFGDMVDTLGTIEVYVQNDAANQFDPSHPFVGGTTEDMDGDRTLDYVRILVPSPGSPPEWARFLRQNAVLDGIYTAMLLPENWLKLPDLINDFYHLLVTDLKPKELRGLYCMLDTVEPANIKVVELPEWMVSANDHGVLYPDIPAVKALIAAMQEWTETLVWVPPTPTPEP
jgi:anionic cell wall polymer biosynthesis LytR-Cps2A-Psr (LCP) family protein